VSADKQQQQDGYGCRAWFCSAAWFLAVLGMLSMEQQQYWVVTA
jgi:hypothetical protein